jgi:hypothetical protein
VIFLTPVKVAKIAIWFSGVIILKIRGTVMRFSFRETPMIHTSQIIQNMFMNHCIPIVSTRFVSDILAMNALTLLFFLIAWAVRTASGA